MKKCGRFYFKTLGHFTWLLERAKYRRQPKCTWSEMAGPSVHWTWSTLTLVYNSGGRHWCGETLLRYRKVKANKSANKCVKYTSCHGKERLWSRSYLVIIYKKTPRMVQNRLRIEPERWFIEQRLWCRTSFKLLRTEKPMSGETLPEERHKWSEDLSLPFVFLFF